MPAFFCVSRGCRTLYTEMIYENALVQATMRDRGRIVKVMIYGLIVVAVLIGGVLGRFIFSMLIESPYALLSNLLCVKSIALCPDNIVEVPMLLGWIAGSKESLMYQDLLGKDRVYVESEMRHRSAYNMIVALSERYICYNLSAKLLCGILLCAG